MPTHNAIQPELCPQLLFTSHATRHTLQPSTHALKLMRGAYWEPQPKTEIWKQLQQVSMARSLAAQNRVRSSTCLSHTSAALLLGLSTWTREPDIYVAVPKQPRIPCTNLPLFRFHPDDYPLPANKTDAKQRQVKLWKRHLDIRPEEIVVVEGVPVTSALRTAFDCAFDEPPHNALVIADSALRLYCESDRRRPEMAEQKEDEARALWDEMFRRNPKRTGIATARAVLESASPWAESAAESMARWFVLCLGLPKPELQAPIATPQGVKYPDLCWPNCKLIVEVDGHLKYHSGQVLVNEKLREESIGNQGWRFIRITTPEFHDSQTLSEKLLAGFPLTVLSRRRPNLLLWGQWRGPGYWLPAGSTLFHKRKK